MGLDYLWCSYHTRHKISENRVIKTRNNFPGQFVPMLAVSSHFSLYSKSSNTRLSTIEPFPAAHTRSRGHQRAQFWTDGCTHSGTTLGWLNWWLLSSKTDSPKILFPENHFWEMCFSMVHIGLNTFIEIISRKKARPFLFGGVPCTFPLYLFTIELGGAGGSPCWAIGVQPKGAPRRVAHC